MYGKSCEDNTVNAMGNLASTKSTTMLASAAYGYCQWPIDIEDTIETAVNLAIEKLNKKAGDYPTVKEEGFLKTEDGLTGIGAVHMTGIVEDHSVAHTVTFDGNRWHITALAVGRLHRI